MKINYQNLSSQLGKASCYLLSGDEPLLIAEARQQIITHHKTKNTEMIHFDPNECGWSQLPLICQNQSLFAGHQIILIKLSSPKIKPEAGKILIHCIEQLTVNTILIIDCPRLDAKTLSAPWVKAIEKSGLWVTLWPLLLKQMSSWLKQRAQGFGLKLTPSANQLIVDYCEGNLLAANQTLEKLSLIDAAGPISVETIQQIITDNSNYDTFAWVDACLAGEHHRQSKIFSYLKTSKIEPTLILWAIAREIRQLMILQNQMTHSSNIQDLLKKQKIFPKKNALYSEVLRSVDMLFWCQLITAIARIDKLLKGAIKGCGWLALQALGDALTSRDPRAINE